MDAIEKLLRKIDRKECVKLERAIERLVNGDHRGLSVIKISNTEFYRLRVGRFRIIFHRDIKRGGYLIDNVRLRNENTYKNL